MEEGERRDRADRTIVGDAFFSRTILTGIGSGAKMIAPFLLPLRQHWELLNFFAFHKAICSPKGIRLEERGSA